MRICVAISAIFWALTLTASNQDEILGSIFKARNDLVEKNRREGLSEENLVFLTIWNFDNTILHGDSTEGLIDGEGRVVYKGLAQMAIEAGLSKKYPAPADFSRFLRDYQKMEEKDEPKAYAYAAQILAGAKESDVLKLSTHYFDTTLKQHFFQVSRDLIASLQNEEIQIRIISASPRLFVQGAAPILNIPIKDIYGMETVVKDGVITDQIILPLMTREGKVEKINWIIKDIQAANTQIKKVYVLSGFGNNNANDIVFLKWIANQPLPMPLAVVGFQPPSLPQHFDTLLLTEEASK